MSRYIVWAVAVVTAGIALAVIVPLFVVPSGSGGPQSSIGDVAPVFVLHNDRGIPVSLQEYRGRVVVMNLWASWCPPCRAEMPELQRLREASARSDVAIVGVNEGESARRARAFAESLQIRFPIWIDAAERYGRTYAALGLPTTVILDQRGVVLRAFDGPLTFAQMESAIRPLVRSH